jgi:phenylalanyl-tRNA synthetase alpha chain
LEKKTKQSTRELIENSSLPEASVNRASTWLFSKGLIDVKEKVKEKIDLDFEGKDYLSNGLPERRVLELLVEKKTIAELDDKLSHDIVKIAIIWLRRLNAVLIADGRLELTNVGKGYLKKKMPQETVLESIAKNKTVPSDLAGEIEQLKKRGRVLEFKEYTEREMELTAKGRQLIEKGITIEKEVSQLTPEMLATGKWKDVKLREYEVEAPSPIVYPGRKHPFRETIDRMREIFIEMGFQEIKGPIAESSFWNFDALFVPQDHPGREMQDTFYLREPKEAHKPPEKYMESVRKVHEESWKYKWDQKKALELLLRTHTTAATCRALTQIKEMPAKVFSIDKVFRNEVLDYKHLPEFYQVEGIVVDKKATLVDLLGILKEFYSRLGFEKVRFAPSFFPYTEPSVEVQVYFEKKKKWMELGGAGIFRKEVVKPLGIDANVLAWGLGGERPLMVTEDLDDIRIIYKNSMGWIRRGND